MKTIYCKVLIKAPDWFIEENPKEPKEITVTPHSIDINFNGVWVDREDVPDSWLEQETFENDGEDFAYYYYKDIVEFNLRGV